jgi:hypothetical protein
MRADGAAADRRHAVREAAKGWRRAGAIDDETVSAIAEAYPDDRVRLGLGLRILAGLASFMGGIAFTALVVWVIETPGTSTLLTLALAALYVAATEIQVGRLRRAQAGAEYATAILAVDCVAWAWLSLVDGTSTALSCAVLAVALAVAAWRWGYALFAALAVAFTLFALSLGAAGRASWFVLGLAGYPLMLRAARSASFPPAHRRCFEAAGFVLVAGAYVATNLYSLDHRWIELFGRADNPGPGAWARRAAIAGTIVMPAVVLWLGVHFRARALLAAGAVFTTASLLTLHAYHPIGPWWAMLVLSGTACLALAIALRRWLDAGPGNERLGFTAESLFGDSRLLETTRTAATLVALAPDPRAAHDGGFEGGGGRSGGGGATGGA